MRVIVHMPRTPEKEKELRQKVSAAYARAVSDQITRLSCPNAQKIELFSEMKQLYSR